MQANEDVANPTSNHWNQIEVRAVAVVEFEEAQSLLIRKLNRDFVVKLIFPAKRFFGSDEFVKSVLHAFALGPRPNDAETDFETLQALGCL
jgi:hypothetical protein